jgi:oxygen-independent coproporphyrinogen-3 oxidase
LGRRKAHGEVAGATEEEERDFFLFTSRFLEEKGYLHYEISNFARLVEPGNKPNYQIINDKESFDRKPQTADRKLYYSRHNRKYWGRVPCLGLGPGAHSFQDGVRWWNFSSVEQYCRSLAQGQAPVAERETLSAEQISLEAIYLGLRTREGVPLDLLRQSPGWENTLRKLKKAGLIEINHDRAVPTLEGFLLADSLPLWLTDGGRGEEKMACHREDFVISGPCSLPSGP